jgi:hypothetical protein
METLKIILEQNGLINIFSVAFSTLLCIKTKRGYLENLLLITSYSSFIADCMLIFTNGPPGIVSTNLASIRAMTFFEVVFWTIRELGLTLYTNRLIKIIDDAKLEKVYYIVYNIGFIVTSIWRLLDMGMRTYDPYGVYIEGKIIMTGNYAYLAMLSALDIWSSIFLLKIVSFQLRIQHPESNAYKMMKQILYSGVLRVIFINFIPIVRVIVSLIITTPFNYQNDVSIIVYSLQVSMNLMYLIDLTIIKIDARIFQTQHIIYR